MEDKVSGEDVNVELVYLDIWMLAGGKLTRSSQKGIEWMMPLDLVAEVSLPVFAKSKA